MTIASARAFAALRDFSRERPPVEWCDLCATPLAPRHDHLLDTQTRRLQCACQPCVCLLGENPGSRWTLVRHGVQRRSDVHVSDEAWQALGLPVDLAFFVHRSTIGRIVALYPSPAGLVEAGVELMHPLLADLRPDVEALLVNRTAGRRDYYLVSIDECYRLVGLLRLHWNGFSGGTEVQERIGQFFAALDGPRPAA
jgi:hypothetical protein